MFTICADDVRGHESQNRNTKQGDDAVRPARLSGCKSAEACGANAVEQIARHGEDHDDQGSVAIGSALDALPCIFIRQEKCRKQRERRTEYKNGYREPEKQR